MAFVGEREAARQAVEEPRAEAAFELGHLMADRALADVEFEPRAGEVEVARRGLEGAEGVQGEMGAVRSEEHTSELQSLMRISYAVFCLKKKKKKTTAKDIEIIQEGYRH